MNPETATFKEFAVLAGYRSENAVRALAKAGRLVLADDRRVRVAESLALIHGTLDPSKDGVRARHAAQRAAADSTDSDEADDAAEQVSVDPVYDSHAKRRAKALADKEEELAAKARRERLVEEGRLLWREQIEPAIGLAFGRLRQALESTAHELAPELAAIDDEDRVVAVLTDRYERLLGNLSRELAALAQT